MNVGNSEFLSLSGSIGAQVTPVDPEGNVLLDDLVGLIRRQRAAGSRAVAILGTTGEGRLLRAEQRREVVRAAAGATDGPILCGVSGETTAAVVKEVEWAAQDGATAAVVTPPAFFRLGPARTETFFEAVADASAIPLLLDHAPGLTKLDPGTEGLMRLAEHPHVVGIVDGSGDLAALHELATADLDVVVLVARAPLIPAALALGAVGSLTPIGGYAPRLEVALMTAVRGGDSVAWRRLHQKVKELSQLIHSTGLPVAVNVKALLAHDGIIGLTASPPPFNALDASERAALGAEAAALGLLPSQLDEEVS